MCIKSSTWEGKGYALFCEEFVVKVVKVILVKIDFEFQLQQKCFEGMKQQTGR